MIVILLVFIQCPNEAYNFLRKSVSYKYDLHNSTLVSPKKLCTMKGKSNRLLITSLFHTFLVPKFIEPSMLNLSKLTPAKATCAFRDCTLSM